MNIIPPEKLKAYADEFEAKYIHLIQMRSDEALARCRDFVTDFPLAAMPELPMENYLWYAGREDMRDTFSFRLQYGVQNSSMKTARPDFYGIYHDGSKYKYSRTLEAMAFPTVQEAYAWQRAQIVSLLEAGSRHDLKAVAANKVNSMVKCKLLSVYYPGDYLPMNTRPYITSVMDALGVSYKSSENTVFCSEQLLSWKCAAPEVRNWNNNVFMRFCDHYIFGEDYIF